MRATTLMVAGLVGASLLLVVAVPAFGFDVSLSQAVAQAWPLALAASLVVALMVELDRRVSW